MRKKVKIVLVMLIITLLMQCFSFNTLIYAVTQITSDDLEKIDKFLPKTFDILTDFCRMDFDKLMSKYNQR